MGPASAVPSLGHAARPGAAERLLGEAAGAGVDLGAITAELERAGVRAFCDAYEERLRGQGDDGASDQEQIQEYYCSPTGVCSFLRL